MEQTQSQTLPLFQQQETSEHHPVQPTPAAHAQNVNQQAMDQQPLPQQNDQYEAFKLFLSTAPVNWSPNESIRRFTLPDGSSVSCVLWNELFHITGTDIVKGLTYRFECLGRTVTMQKKFEEGIFSDLRNLKPLSDSTLEESRSPFLKFLYENQCIRTQKKQKVFYWFSVKHDKLFLDALERDLKRENAGQVPCTVSRVPMSMVKSMELAKAQCMPQIQVPNNQMSKQKYPVSVPNSLNIMEHPTPRMSASHSASSSQYAPVLNYIHPLDPIHHRTYSPFQQSGNHHVLHPGSPPQGLLTPPIMHQQYAGASPQIHSLDHHDDYRIHRTDSPMGIHRPDSGLGIHRPDSALSIHRNDSPAKSIMSYQDGSSHMHYDGAQVLSSMFNPHDYSASSGTSFNNNSISARYSPYQSTMQSPIPIRPQGQSPQYQKDDLSDGKIYDCPQPGCNRQFKRQEHIKRHYRSHTGERPYTCIVPECRRSFSRQDHLQQHMRGHNEGGFRLDDNMLQSLVNSPQSDFAFPTHSPSVSAYGTLEYQPMRSDSRLSMHSSFEPLMSIPPATSTSAPVSIAAPTTQNDDVVAATAAAVAVEQVSSTEQDAVNAESNDSSSGRAKQEYAQHMEYAMENLLAMDPEMRFQSY